MEDGAPKVLFGGKRNRFKSGPDWNGNAQGRPRKKLEPAPPPPKTPKDVAQDHGLDMIAELAKIAKDTGMAGSTRVAAANSVLDRGFGKPQQVIEANLTVFDQMSDAELLRFLGATEVEGELIEGELIEDEEPDEAAEDE